MEKKRVATLFGAIALTAALTVTGTLALMSQITETKTNTFTSSQDLKTKLEEKFDEEEAKNYLPGQVITKAPKITNEGDSSQPVYVAAKLSFKDNEGKFITREEFEKKYAEILGFSDKWEKISAYEDGSELYMLNEKVEVGKSSPAIFEETKVLAGIEEVIKTEFASSTLYEQNADGEWKVVDKNETSNTSKKLYAKDGEGNYSEVDAYELPKFEIVVTGYAVQGNDGVSQNDAKAELMKLAAAQ